MRDLSDVIARESITGKMDQRMPFGGADDFERAFAHISAPTSIIDFGCGSGYVLKWLHEQFPDARLVGVDAIGLTIPRERYGAFAEFLQHDFHELPMFADGEFDCGLAATSLRMSRWPQLAVQELCRVSRHSCIVLEGRADDNAQMAFEDWQAAFERHGMRLLTRFPTTPPHYYFMVYTCA
jgi:ubiquinone/menaquinone biosynthesis C-methylase UbiE